MSTAPLNIQPRGLLDFLGVKSGGWGPRDLVPTLQPQLDLWRHYVAANGQDVEGSTAAVPGVVNNFRIFTPISWVLPAPFASTPNPVPQTELWYIDTMSVDASVSLGAGSRIVGMVLGARVDLTSGQLLLLPTTTRSTLDIEATNESGWFGSMLYPCFLRPGSELGVVWAGTVATTETLVARVTARIVRMRL